MKLYRTVSSILLALALVLTLGACAKDAQKAPEENVTPDTSDTSSTPEAEKPFEGEWFENEGIKMLVPTGWEPYVDYDADDHLVDGSVTSEDGNTVVSFTTQLKGTSMIQPKTAQEYKESVADSFISSNKLGSVDLQVEEHAGVPFYTSEFHYGDDETKPLQKKYYSETIQVDAVASTDYDREFYTIIFSVYGSEPDFETAEKILDTVTYKELRDDFTFNVIK